MPASARFTIEIERGGWLLDHGDSGAVRCARLWRNVRGGYRARRLLAERLEHGEPTGELDGLSQTA